MGGEGREGEGRGGRGEEGGEGRGRKGEEGEEKGQNSLGKDISLCYLPHFDNSLCLI